MGTAHDPTDHPPAAPGAAPRSDPERVLARVRALLAKAESTTFPEEAEALTAKAQELMARHSLDDALAAAGPGADEARPGRRRVGIAAPYVSPKVHLLTAVARANRCEAVWLKDDAVVVVFGYEVDLDAVELLFTSLLVQATAAALSAGPRTDRSGRSRTRSFRSSFLVSFAARVGERLAEAAATVEAAAAAEEGAGLLPVLAGRSEAVRTERDAAFPRLRTARTSVTNGEGWAAGRRAADRASLDGQGRVTGRGPGRLGR